MELPEAMELTIITTLDPCVMCTGSMLTAGFNVGVVAIDDFAGINYDRKFTFEDLPRNLRDLAKSKFGYYACGHKDRDPSIYVRDYSGASNVAFSKNIVGAQRLAGCDDIFRSSVSTIRENSSNIGSAPEELRDPATLPSDSQIKTHFREIYPNAFKVKLAKARLPNAELHSIIKNVKDSTPNADNAVALLDPFGNLVLCLPDTFNESPVHTAFMNVTRSYAITRFELMNDRATRQETSKYLTHPKYGTFVFLHAPNPSDATTIMTLGAYGSTMEGPVPKIFPANFQYYRPPQEGTVEELRSVIMNLPPFYTQLAQISAMEVAALIE